MGTSALMSVAVRALNANYAALQTTGHNIANANVSGYSRQTVQLETAQGQFSGAGYFGKGVNVTTVMRSHNEFLTREAASTLSLAAMDTARLGLLKRMENVFQTGENGLGNAASEMFDALNDLASRPADLATRQVVLARASDLAARFNEAGRALDDAQTGVTADLKASVADVNALAKAIANANERIVAARGLAQAPNDLLDERERLISKLSEQVKVTRIEAEDGSLGIFIGGGQRLVLGNQAAQLKVIADPADPTRSAVGLMEGSAVRQLDSNALGGGTVAGLLAFQNIDLANGRNLVGQLAVAVGTAVNQVQASGLTLQTPLGSITGSPLFALGASAGVPNTYNARDSDNQFVGSVALTITDATALRGSDYDLRESTSNPGSWELTRLSDGMVSTVNNGDVVDGFRIDINNAQPGDRFRLQPTSRAANGMTTLLTDPRDLAAASPLVASAQLGNTGTVAVSGLQVSPLPLPVSGATARINFTSDSGDYDWQLTDADNNVLSSGSGTWRAGQTIPPAAGDINGFTLNLSGVPRSGDVLTVAPTPTSAVASNNGNALSMSALRDAAISNGRNITDAWSHTLADIGVRVQTATSASTISTAMAEQASQQANSETGVNLDEEAARLIQYQQSYQAAAKVMQTAQALFDTLLDMSR